MPENEKQQIISKLYEKVLGPYSKSNGRKHVVVKLEDGTYQTISYPKYLMEEHLGRRLDPELETVDHIDSNHYNDEISNLRLMPREEHSSFDTRRVKLIELVCDMCGEKFQRTPRIIRIKARLGKRGYFCSRRCSGRYGRLLALKKIKKMKKQQHVESEYYKKKYLEGDLVEQGHPQATLTPEDILITVE